MAGVEWRLCGFVRDFSGMPFRKALWDDSNWMFIGLKKDGRIRKSPVRDFLRLFGQIHSVSSVSDVPQKRRRAQTQKNSLWDFHLFKADKHPVKSSRRALKGHSRNPEQSHINATQPLHKIVCFPLEQKLRRRCHGKEKQNQKKIAAENAD
ncbi:hypothetical protein CEXT_48851 [Caerostris extrusa]|uniref:Uncharacterized protein n=1 Tax=Caerostris extrusa TaxID=172846 RepID=A0AAV4RHR0_CAEEX|nr:hypothetical protein CEXT_48851 [Caerostris extrusa]